MSSYMETIRRKRSERKDRVRRKRPSALLQRMLRVERLEDRRMLATVSDGGGTTLTIDLDNADEALQIVTDGTVYKLTSTNNFVANAVVDPANQGKDTTGYGTQSLTVTATGVAAYNTINVIDSAAGTSVTFNNSVGAYSDVFTITLDNSSAATGLQFNGSSSFGNNNLTANIDSHIDLGASAQVNVGTQTLTLNATGGSINGGTDDNTADLIGAEINLTASSGGIGTTTPLDVTASTALNADSTADNSSILIDSIGNLPVGLVDAGAGDVTLNSSRKITDADGNPTVDVAGDNITMRSGVVTSATPAPTDGGIGEPGNFLEVNTDRNGTGGLLAAFDVDAPNNGGIYLDEVVGDMRVDRVFSNADVSLRTVDGSVLDARVENNVNVRAQSLDIDANGAGATIGADGNDLEVDTSRNSPAPRDTSAGGDDVALEATGDIYLEEVDGYLRLVLAHSFEGNIVLFVRESSQLDENLILVHSGSARFAENGALAPAFQADADRIIDNGTIFAEQGEVSLLVGDNVETDSNSDILAAKDITINGDYLNFDFGNGATIVLRGRIVAGADVTPGDQIGGTPLGTAIPTYTAPQYRTRINGSGDADTIQFGDTSGSTGGTNQGDDGFIFLGSTTEVFGSSGEDSLLAYYLQDTATVTSPAQFDALTVLGREDAQHTLRLDGGANTDHYEVHTLGSNGADQRNYLINVLDTGAPNEGVDRLSVYGADGIANGKDDPTDDIFLLRPMASIPGETADHPAFVSVLHGTLEQARTVDPGGSPLLRSPEVQRINYDAGINGRLEVFGLGGNDYFAVDDNSALTTLDGGEGSDRFQIGQMYGSKREVAAMLLPVDVFATISTTRGELSRGISFPTVAHGGTGNDDFSVYSNKAELRLEGDDGDDEFVVRAFIVTDGSGGSGTTQVKAGGGDDLVQNNINAPVFIDGGEGVDGEDRSVNPAIILSGEKNPPLPSGIYLINGQLQLIGGDESDVARVTRFRRGGQPWVRAYLDLGDPQSDPLVRRFRLSAIDSIYMDLGGGDDVASVGKRINRNTLILGGAGNDRITGGRGRDRILGQDGNDVISGRQGGDRLFGNDGNDLLRGGRGSDVLDGGNDDDTLRGNRGNDILLGGSGIDSLSGGNGKDILIGGTEADTLSGGRKADILIGGSTLLDDDIPALKAILREWTSGRRYARRTQNIRGDSTSGRNNPYFFKPDEPDRTVSDDSQADRLNGNRGRDWFFADLDNADGDDDVVIRRSNELVELIKEL